MGFNPLAHRTNLFTSYARLTVSGFNQISAVDLYNNHALVLLGLVVQLTVSLMLSEPYLKMQLSIKLRTRLY